MRPPHVQCNKPQEKLLNSNTQMSFLVDDAPQYVTKVVCLEGMHMSHAGASRTSSHHLLTCLVQASVLCN